ncbi:response regulator transcription factor [Lacrimispora sp. 38-1]|uniref:response regulator transcription factor n=1 Tax=Lacrimispora sp. 38-1 TaxID=3125778 RepID=UPI003CEE5D12
MNLLLVNDAIITVETMKTEIPWKEYGIDEVFTAYDAEKAKARIQECPIDLMLCDIEMPGENGIEVLRWVRKNEIDIECIFLTCHASFEYAKEAIQLGCQDYILIPAMYEDIGEAVQKVVNRIKKQQDSERFQEYGKLVVKDKIEHATENYGQKNQDELVDTAIGYIVQDLAKETLSVNDIADRLFLHPVYLNRIFKKEKGVSVGQYIIAERMKMAGELLKTKHLSANVVSELVGYKSYANFNLMFKKYYGCAPSQYVNEDKYK